MKTKIAKYTGQLLYLVAGLTIALSSCTSNKKADDDYTSKVEAQTPVTVTTIDQNSMTDYIDLNATSHLTNFPRVRKDRTRQQLT